MTSPNVFILDDDEQYSQLLVDVAQETGKTVHSERSAVAFLESDLPETGVLVLDLILPELDGIEVIRALSKKQKQYALILISGFDDRVLHSAKQLAEAHNMEVLACFNKPLEIDKFKSLIQSLKNDQSLDSISESQQSYFSPSELMQAIEKDELVLHYQPQINLSSNKLIGFEALVRWDHPNYGLIYPDKFIHLAEEHDLIGALSRSVIKTACRDLSWHRGRMEGMVVSINVSSKNVTSLDLPEQLHALTTEYSVEPSQLNIELTETAVMEELTSSLDVLNRLRLKGFSLSIDDFGTGYSSLSQLYNAPFSELKIDRTFVSKMEQDNEAMVIVKICIMLGSMLGMKVVAEGIETERELIKLRDLGCDIGQGYGIAKPQALTDALKWKESQCKNRASK